MLQLPSLAIHNHTAMNRHGYFRRCMTMAQRATADGQPWPRQKTPPPSPLIISTTYMETQQMSIANPTAAEFEIMRRWQATNKASRAALNSERVARNLACIRQSLFTTKDQDQ
jgi:hypothetical protein